MTRRRLLEGEPMPRVNLDALIKRQDFEVLGEPDDGSDLTEITLQVLQRNQLLFDALRKPDFQRETSDWDTDRIVGLIRSFIDRELIPAVILWRHHQFVFVIDGSHRLSALIAWANDDYGDGDISRKFFEYDIPSDQKRQADKTSTTTTHVLLSSCSPGEVGCGFAVSRQLKRHGSSLWLPLDFPLWRDLGNRMPRS
jgi:hypothetical protein